MIFHGKNPPISLQIARKFIMWAICLKIHILSRYIFNMVYISSEIHISSLVKQRFCTELRTQFQIEGGGLVQGVTKLIRNVSTFMT